MAFSSSHCSRFFAIGDAIVSGSEQLEVAQVALHGDGAFSGGLRLSCGDGLPMLILRQGLERDQFAKWLGSPLTVLFGSVGGGGDTGRLPIKKNVVGAVYMQLAE